MYFGALLLKLVYPGLQVGQLALELLNLLGVWLHGLVEGSSEKVVDGTVWVRIGMALWEVGAL